MPIKETSIGMDSKNGVYKLGVPDKYLDIQYDPIEKLPEHFTVKDYAEITGLSKRASLDRLAASGLSFKTLFNKETRRYEKVYFKK